MLHKIYGEGPARVGGFMQKQKPKYKGSYLGLTLNESDSGLVVENLSFLNTIDNLDVKIHGDFGT